MKNLLMKFIVWVIKKLDQHHTRFMKEMIVKYNPAKQRVKHYKTVHIHKGKIREFRTYDYDGNRIDPPLIANKFILNG